LKWRRGSVGLLAGAIIMCAGAGAGAQQQSRVMPLEQVKQILEMTKDSWVAFRNYDGRQLYYLTHLVAWRCGIREVRYSENSDSLDQEWPLPPCNESMPNAVPQDAKVYERRPLASVSALAVQVVFDDGTMSPVRVYEPCEGAGEATCGYLKSER
jgi:hypothetical protein